MRDSLRLAYEEQGDAAAPRALANYGFALSYGLRDLRSGYGDDPVRYVIPPDTLEGLRLLRLAEARGDTLASHYLWLLSVRRAPARAAAHIRTSARRGARWAARYAVEADALAGRFDTLAALLAHPVAGPNVRREAEALRRVTRGVAASGDSAATTIARRLDALLEAPPSLERPPVAPRP